MASNVSSYHPLGSKLCSRQIKVSNTRKKIWYGGRGGGTEWVVRIYKIFHVSLPSLLFLYRGSGPESRLSETLVRHNSSFVFRSDRN